VGVFWAKAADTLRELVGCGTAHRSSVLARYDTSQVFVPCSLRTSRIRKPSTDMIWKFGKSCPISALVRGFCETGTLGTLDLQVMPYDDYEESRKRTLIEYGRFRSL